MAEKHLCDPPAPKRSKCEQVVKLPTSTEDCMVATLRTLEKMAKNLESSHCLSSGDPEDRLRRSMEQRIARQGDRAVYILLQMIKPALPRIRSRGLCRSQVEDFIYSIHAKIEQLTNMLLDSAPTSLPITWDLWIGYIGIAGTRLCLNLLTWVQAKRTKAIASRAASSSVAVSSMALADNLTSTDLHATRPIADSSIAALSSSIGTSMSAAASTVPCVDPPHAVIEPSTAAVLAGALAPGWAMHIAPPANPADEGQLATPEVIAGRGYAGPPLLPEGTRLNVPADGLCLSYSLLAARDVQRLQATPRDRYGFVLDGSARDFRKGARAFRERCCERGLLAGATEQAEEIMRGVFPEGQALNWYAEEVGGSILITIDYWNSISMLFGEGPIVAHILNHLQVGPDGHEAPHYLLLQSYLPQSRRHRNSSFSSSSSSS